MVRRLKSELPADFDGSPRFPPRRLREIPIELPEEELRAHADLRRYGELLKMRVAESAASAASDFVLLLLKKRLLSSPAAFGNTLAVHRRTRADRAPDERAAAPANVLRAYMERVEEPFDDDDAYQEAEDRAHRAAAAALARPSAEEAALLDRLAAWAQTAAARPDARAAALIAHIEAVCRPGGRWNDERLIVFTEFRDTQKWLFELLAARNLTSAGRVELLSGGMDDDARTHVKAAFQADPADAPVRVLIGTDAASEGINLQRHCHRVVHYEIPWNPVRLEQRNGRVDRHGQTADEVLVHHFVPAGYAELRGLDELPVGELAGDLEFLRRTVEKVESIREMLGNVGPVIASQVQQAMLGGRRRLDTAAAEATGARVQRQLAFERRLEERIAELVRAYDDTRAELRLSPDHVREVVQVGLELDRQPPLAPEREPGTLRMPALTGSWARCAEGLAHPYTGAIRPISFDPDVVAGRDDLVLCHVGHRLVQTALRTLRAAVFDVGGSADGLARVTAPVVSHPRLREPLAVAYARLVITGAEGHRLHEEVIQAGGHVRERRLERLGVTALAEALQGEADRPPPEALGRRVLDLDPALVEQLDAALGERARERARSLRETIERRMSEEADRAQRVLEELRTSIETELERTHEQLSLFDADDRRQLSLDREYLRTRLGSIPDEIEAERGHLARRFRDPEPRVFPIAVEYRLPAAQARP